MKRFLKNVVSMVRRSDKRRVFQVPQARPQVEGLEERLAMSTLSPAPVDPLKCVHGYKWRNPIYFPHIVTSGTPASGIALPANAPAPATASLAVPGLATSLVIGGADGTTVLASGGQIVVVPPIGPLPII
jgi:hypothetical protein